MPKHLPASLFISSILFVVLSAPVLAATPKLKITNLTAKSVAELRASELTPEEAAKIIPLPVPSTTKAALRLNFQTRLATIKDTVKKNTVTRIDNMMATVNQNRTSEMLRNLTTMSAILDRVATRAATAKSNGKDTVAVDSAVAAARSQLTTAHDLVLAQSEKQYMITINSETTLKSDVKATVDAFKVDIKATHEVVVATREAVRAAIQALVKVL